LLHCWWGCTLVQPLWRTAWKHLKKSKVELPYDPAIPFLGIYLEKIIIQKDTCTPMFIAASFTIARTCCCCCSQVASVVSDSVRPHRHGSNISIRLQRDE
uniref:Uncharacterized protein n=1 Tax=Ovis aries TaxID=9940 RepID=A0AC11EMZ2_SHEEP